MARFFRADTGAVLAEWPLVRPFSANRARSGETP
jgi:hypothetical protein